MNRGIKGYQGIKEFGIPVHPTTSTTLYTPCTPPLTRDTAIYQLKKGPQSTDSWAESCQAPPARAEAVPTCNYQSLDQLGTNQKADTPNSAPPLPRIGHSPVFQVKLPTLAAGDGRSQSTPRLVRAQADPRTWPEVVVKRDPRALGFIYTYIRLSHVSLSS